MNRRGLLKGILGGVAIIGTGVPALLADRVFASPQGKVVLDNRGKVISNKTLDGIHAIGGTYIRCILNDCEIESAKLFLSCGIYDGHITLACPDVKGPSMCSCIIERSPICRHECIIEQDDDPRWETLA